MEKLQIKKIEKPIKLDTKVEGCWNDCYAGKKWEGYTAGMENEFGCKQVKKYNAKKCWLW